MNKSPFIAICFFAAALMDWGCGNPEPAGFPLTLATLQKIDSGSILFEEKEGKIVVYITDRLGDSHIHILAHDGISKDTALDMVRRKQLELIESERNRAMKATR
jgi:hypothetical protein